MRDHRHAAFGPLPTAAEHAPIAASFAVVALLVAGLVAASYPVVALAAVAGALTVPLVRRAAATVESVRARLVTDRTPSIASSRSPRAE